MKVVTTASSASPDGYLDPEKCVEVPDAFGKHLIAQGGARPATADEKVNAQWPHSTEVPKPEVK